MVVLKTKSKTARDISGIGRSNVSQTSSSGGGGGSSERTVAVNPDTYFPDSNSTFRVPESQVRTPPRSVLVDISSYGSGSGLNGINSSPPQSGSQSTTSVSPLIKSLIRGEVTAEDIRTGRAKAFERTVTPAEAQVLARQSLRQDVEGYKFSGVSVDANQSVDSQASKRNENILFKSNKRGQVVGESNPLKQQSVLYQSGELKQSKSQEFLFGKKEAVGFSSRTGTSVDIVNRSRGAVGIAKDLGVGFKGSVVDPLVSFGKGVGKLVQFEAQNPSRGGIGSLNPREDNLKEKNVKLKKLVKSDGDVKTAVIGGGLILSYPITSVPVVVAGTIQTGRGAYNIGSGLLSKDFVKVGGGVGDVVTGELTLKSFKRPFIELTKTKVKAEDVFGGEISGRKVTSKSTSEALNQFEVGRITNDKDFITVYSGTDFNSALKIGKTNFKKGSYVTTEKNTALDYAMLEDSKGVLFELKVNKNILSQSDNLKGSKKFKILQDVNVENIKVSNAFDLSNADTIKLNQLPFAKNLNKGNKIEVVSAGPSSLTGGKLVDVGAGPKGAAGLEDSGLFVGPKTRANLMFTGLGKEGGDSSLTMNPFTEVKRFFGGSPVVSGIVVSDVVTPRASVLGQAGFLNVNKEFVGQGVAVITKRSMIGKGELKPQMFSPVQDFRSEGGLVRLKGKLYKEGGTSETEAVIPTGSVLKKVSNKEFTVVNQKRLFGRDVPLTGDLIELPKYELVSNKKSSTKLSKGDDLFDAKDVGLKDSFSQSSFKTSRKRSLSSGVDNYGKSIVESSQSFLSAKDSLVNGSSVSNRDFSSGVSGLSSKSFANSSGRVVGSTSSGFVGSSIRPFSKSSSLVSGGQSTSSISKVIGSSLQGSSLRVGSSFKNFQPSSDFKFRSGESRFSVDVRSKGRFVSVGEGLNLKDAIKLGKNLTGGSSARSFKIKTQAGKNLKGLNIGGDYYKKGDVYIEKSSSAINTGGELKQITFKGIATQKRKRLGVF